MQKVLKYEPGEVLAPMILDASKRTGVPAEDLVAEFQVADNIAQGVVVRHKSTGTDLIVMKPETSFRMVRAGTGYNPVILITPSNARPDNPDHPRAKYFECDRWKKSERWNPDGFNEISYEEARLAFSGMADGWGFAKLPVEPFPSLEAVLDFIRKNSN